MIMIKLRKKIKSVKIIKMNKLKKNKFKDNNMKIKIMLKNK